MGANRIVKINLSTLNTGAFENDLSLTIMPNPVLNTLTIDTAKKIKAMFVFDSVGKKLETVTVSKNTIEVSQLSSGLYFINLVDENNKTFSAKFIKE